MTLHMRQTMPDPAVYDDAQSFASLSAGIYRQRLKRALDLVFVLVTLPIVLPVILFLAAAIALDGSNPFYRQKRLGRGGRVFGMWKLRSMVPDAETLLDAHLAGNPAAMAEWRFHQKLRHDPRITRIGRVIRKSSLDELPQLWNVLVGDMSLVGPRPMMVDQRAYYPGTAYFAMRPGITGFWQTSERNETSFHERASFDADYMRKLSLGTDIAILWRTIRVVIRGTGC